MHAYQETVKANLNSNVYKRMRLLIINTIKQTALEQQSNVSGWLWTFWYDAFACDTPPKSKSNFCGWAHHIRKL